MADLATTKTPGKDASRHGLLLATLTAAIFLSAALLFAVQPMFTKLVLPRLGGAPSVWSVAMVFFQAALLAGYGYAHLLTRFAPGRISVVIHLVVMIAACFALPLHIAANGSVEADQECAVVLAGDATELVARETAERLEGVGIPPARELFQKLLYHQVPVYV